MIRQVISLGIRNDSAGSGEWGAPRGDRTHKGIDIECIPRQPVLSPVKGIVTKHGICYSDSGRWKYVQVTDSEGRDHRLFYVEPRSPIGTTVTEDTPVGVAQDISQRYPGQGMRPHVHYEIKRGQEYLEPV